MQTLKQIGGRYVVKVAVINRKGGPGKTMITANLAGELVARGNNVGVVDTDAQGGGHLAIVLGLPPEDGLFRAMVGDPAGQGHQRVPVDQVARRANIRAYLTEQDIGSDADVKILGNLFVLPASKNTYRIPWLMDDDAGLFADVLDDFARLFDLDVILIDTGPSMSMFDGAIYDAADAFLFVTEAETLSLVGINDSFEQVERRNRRRVQAGKLPNKVLGIVPNKVGGLREHYYNIDQLRATFGAELVWQPIRRLKAYAQMANRGQIVRAYAPGGPEAEQMAALVEQFEGTVATWLTIK